ncbi:MAG: hypothetical protein VB051_13020 [Candidatus Pelethousia sp.]|nr:hypothetical protein [Candidatus Pelethousia sp.]
MKKLHLMIAIIFISVYLAGCAGSDKLQVSPTADSPTQSEPNAATTADSGESISSLIIEPEELISKEEAEQLLGEAVKDGEKNEQAVVGQKICFYNAHNEDSLSYLQISITQTSFMKSDGQTPESIYTSTKEALIETGEQRQIDGVGDEYFFGTPGLHILKDGYYLCIAAGNSDAEKLHQVLEQAGALAVGNLERILSR